MAESYRSKAGTSADAESAALAEWGQVLLRLRKLILLPAGLLAIALGVLTGGLHATGYLPILPATEGSYLIGGPTMAAAIALGAGPVLGLGYLFYRQRRAAARSAWAARVGERYGLDRDEALALSRMLS